MPAFSQITELKPGAASRNEQSEAGIQFFHGSWEEVLQESNTKNKPIFIDVYTSWCGPCKKMARDVFTQPNVGDFFNEYFINYKIDAEKGEGPEIASKYGVRAYPTMLLLSPQKQEVLHTIVGGRSPEQLIDEARKGINNTEILADYEKQFDSGNREIAFLQKYLKELSVTGKTNDKTEAVTKAFISGLSKSDYQNPDNLKLLFNMATDIESPAIKAIQSNRKAFNKAFTAERVSTTLQRAAFKAVDKAIQAKDPKQMETITALLKKESGKEGKRYVMLANLKFYKGVEDWNSYLKIAQKNLTSNETDAVVLNDAAWQVYLHSDDPKLIDKAIAWVEQSIAIKSGYHNNDTYAALLFKTGRLAEALVAAEKAIALAKLEKKSSKSTQELVNKIVAQRKSATTN